MSQRVGVAPTSSPKLLFIDIEWAPAKAYVWRMWDENVSPEQLIDAGGMLCFCAHFDGQRDYQFYSKWHDGRKGMARAARRLLSEADAVVTYNGDKYDLPKIQGEILLAGLTPPPPPTSIDVLKAVKKFGFVMNRLAYIGPLLVGAQKVKHEGFHLWKEVLAGDAKAQAKMQRYCIQDVRLLKQVYHRVRPFITKHPHLGPATSCSNCQSRKTQSRGFRRTKSFRIQRIQCTSCGAWQDGKREKMA